MSDPAVDIGLAPSSRKAKTPSILVVCTLMFLGGCEARQTRAPQTVDQSQPLRVTVVAPPYKWVVEQLAGSHVEIVVLARGGLCAETYQPTDAEVSRILRSHMLIRLGLPFEEAPWFRSLLHNSSLHPVDLRSCYTRGDFDGTDTPVVATPYADSQKVSPLRKEPAHRDVCDAGHQSHDDEDALEDCCPESHDHHHIEHHHWHLDLHIWLVPRLLKNQAMLIVHKLCELDERNCKTYRANLRVFSQRMEELDGQLREVLSRVEGRRVLVFHPGWGHVAREYGLVEVAVEHEGKLPSEAELSRLQAELRAAGARGILVENDNPQHPGRILANSLGLTAVTIDPIAENIEETLKAFAEFADRFAF